MTATSSNEPAGLPEKVLGLFRRLRAGAPEPQEQELPSVSWVRWFDTPQTKRGRLHLSRSGLETFISMVVGAHDDEEGDLVLVIDPLLPSPERSTPDEVVSLDAKLLHMDEGIEISTTFRALLGQETEQDGYEAVELVEISDLDVDYREYMARVTEAHGVELNLMWQGGMVTVYPSQLSAGRFLFDAELDGDIGPDGIEIPKASVCLESGGDDYALSLRLYRRPSPEYEAEITRIDAPIKEKLVRLVEEVWRAESGLGRLASSPRKQVGYRTKQHDALADAFKHHIVYLGEDPGWGDFLKNYGIVREIATLSPSDLVDIVLGGRCDLFVGDLAFCGDESIPIEHTLQAYARTRRIPRFWIQPADNDTEYPDMRLEGAFDQFDSEQLKQAGLTTLFKWALGGDSIGSGNKVLLVSGDDRIRYRLGLAISEAGGRIVWRDGWRGLLPQLKHLAPRVILLDERTVKYDLDSILEPILEVAPLLNYKIVLLIEKASGASILRWKQMGVYDIVLLDPSLRDTEKRVTLWLDLEEKP